MFEDTFLTVFLTMAAITSVVATVGAFMLNKDVKRLQKENMESELLHQKSA